MLFIGFGVLAGILLGYGYKSTMQRHFSTGPGGIVDRINDVLAEGDDAPVQVSIDDLQLMRDVIKNYDETTKVLASTITIRTAMLNAIEARVKDLTTVTAVVALTPATPATPEAPAPAPAPKRKPAKPAKQAKPARKGSR